MKTTSHSSPTWRLTARQEAQRTHPRDRGSSIEVGKRGVDVEAGRSELADEQGNLLDSNNRRLGSPLLPSIALAECEVSPSVGSGRCILPKGLSGSRPMVRPPLSAMRPSTASEVWSERMGGGCLITLWRRTGLSREDPYQFSNALQAHVDGKRNKFDHRALDG